MSDLHDDFPPHAQAREEAMLTEKAEARVKLRDEFAGRSLTIAYEEIKAHTRIGITPIAVAATAYEYADAMMKARGE